MFSRLDSLEALRDMTRGAGVGAVTLSLSELEDLLAVARAASDLSDEEFSDGPLVGRVRFALAKLKEATDA